MNGKVWRFLSASTGLPSCATASTTSASSTMVTFVSFSNFNHPFMLVSYKWLQTYFDETLPEPKKLGELLTMRVLELDGLEEKGGDMVLDIKVLADRAHYCLSHRGSAGEISAIPGFARKTPQKPAIDGRNFSGD